MRQATVQSDLLVYEHRHRVSFDIDQLICLLHSVGSQPRCSSTFAAALNALCCRLVDSFLHQSPNSVINRFNIREVEQPHVRSNEFGFLTTKQLHCLTCTMSQCIVLLERRQGGSRRWSWGKSGCLGGGNHWTPLGDFYPQRGPGAKPWQGVWGRSPPEAGAFFKVHNLKLKAR